MLCLFSTVVLLPVIPHGLTIISPSLLVRIPPVPQGEEKLTLVKYFPWAKHFITILSLFSPHSASGILAPFFRGKFRKVNLPEVIQLKSGNVWLWDF